MVKMILKSVDAEIAEIVRENGTSCTAMLDVKAVGVLPPGMEEPPFFPAFVFTKEEVGHKNYLVVHSMIVSQCLSEVMEVDCPKSPSAADEISVHLLAKNYLQSPNARETIAYLSAKELARITGKTDEKALKALKKSVQQYKEADDEERDKIIKKIRRQAEKTRKGRHS